MSKEMSPAEPTLCLVHYINLEGHRVEDKFKIGSGLLAILQAGDDGEDRTASEALSDELDETVTFCEIEVLT